LCLVFRQLDSAHQQRKLVRDSRRPCPSIPDSGHVNTPSHNLLAQTQSPAAIPDESLQTIPRGALQNKKGPAQGSPQSFPTQPYSPSNPVRMSVNPGLPDRSVWLVPNPNRLIPAPYLNQALNVFVSKSGCTRSARRQPAAPRPAHNSVPAASSISWWPTHLYPPGHPEELSTPFSSNAASSSSGRSECLKLKPRIWGKTLSPHTTGHTLRPLTTAALLLVCSVAWMLTTFFLPSSSYLNTEQVFANRCVGQTYGWWPPWYSDRLTVASEKRQFPRDFRSAACGWWARGA